LCKEESSHPLYQFSHWRRRLREGKSSSIVIYWIPH
jgi:hypothetical protein